MRRRAVTQLEDQRAALGSPLAIRLPVVDVLADRRVDCRVVLQAADGRGRVLLYEVRIRVSVTRHGRHLWIAGLEDVQALIAAEAELERDRAPGLCLVEDVVAIRILVVDRLEEAGPVIGD